MDKQAQKLKEQIEKLTHKLQKIEEKHEKSIAKLIKDISKKGIDIRLLAGMVMNAETVLKSFTKEVEAWQDAGEKFLFKSKNKSTDDKDKPAKKQA